MIRERKRGYTDTQKMHILEDDANRIFKNMLKTLESLKSLTNLMLKACYQDNLTKKQPRPWPTTS